MAKIAQFLKEMKAARKITPSKEKRFLMGASAFIFLGSGVSVFIQVGKALLKNPRDLTAWGTSAVWLLILGTAYWFFGYGFRVIGHAKKDPLEFQKALEALDEEAYLKKCKKDKLMLKDSLPPASNQAPKKRL